MPSLKNPKRLTALAALLMSSLACLAPGLDLPAHADSPGWILTQKSSTLGDQYVYISPEGLKCINPQAGFALVTRAPDWNIVLFNEKTKVYYSTTLNNWKQDMAKNGFKSPLAGKTWAKGAASNIAGMKATEYKMTGGGGKRVSAADYWVSTEIAVPPALTSLLTTAYGLPETSSVPLRLHCQDGGKAKTMLDTYRSQKSAIPVNTFSCPPGLKAVRSEAEVMFSDDQRQMIDDMTKDIKDLK